MLMGLSWLAAYNAGIFAGPPSLQSPQCQFQFIAFTNCAPGMRRSMPTHSFVEGDRVRAQRRAKFPDGTVLKLMDLGYLLIRWDSDVLETAHHSELQKIGDKA